MIRRTSKISLTAIGMIAMVAVAFSFGAMKEDDTTSLEGKMAPQFSAKTIDGKSVSLAGEKGNVVLMDFWATWCPPCKASLPHIQELASDKELAAKGFKVWAVDTNWRGDNKEKASKFVEANHYTFTVPLDSENAATKKFLANAIPTTVLIGRDGVIKKVYIGFDPDRADAMKKDIEDALAEKGKPA
jgi:peroxiredoxin